MFGSFQMNAQVYSLLGQTKEEKRAFFGGGMIYLFSKLCLTDGLMLNIIKCSSFSFYSPHENREHLGSLQNVLVSFSFKCVQVYSILTQTERERKAFFGGCK